MDAHDPDHPAHLKTIHSLVRALRAWTGQFDQQVAHASVRPARDDYEEDQIIEMFYNAGFADLARGHALVCTFSAFIESQFKASLPELGRFGTIRIPANDARLMHFGGDLKSFWDPRIKRAREGFSATVCTILNGSGLLKYFGPDFERCISALFVYRNSVVHNGYEWPMEERMGFKQHLDDENWAGWFTMATSGSEPWFFTPAPAFETACLELCDRSVLAFEGLLRCDWELYEHRFGRMQA